MGIREMLSKANARALWELDTLLRTGRMPAARNLQPTTSAPSYSPQYPPQQANGQVEIFDRTPCGSCGASLSVLAQFCHKCGSRVR